MNKIAIEITSDGWKTDVTIKGKTYSERHIGHYGRSECVEGNLEEEDEIPEVIFDAINDFFCFTCQQALLEYENEEGEYEDD
jgi:hypothetical protein